MSHLLKFRKGWQSEHLARFIISKFAFIAQPLSISDDLGSDFYCTIFEIGEKGWLLPQSSFAIQIKSNNNSIPINNKLDYFQNLEMPFFIGVMNKRKQILSLYSGEVIPHFFSLHGNPNIKPIIYQTYITLTDKTNSQDWIIKNDTQNSFNILFPKILELSIDFDYEVNQDKMNPLKRHISVIQKNLSARKSKEYIFEIVDSPLVMIYTGKDSAMTYKDNFYKRLAEALYNLNWIATYQNEPRVEEFEMYKEVFIRLCRVYSDIPDYLISAYQANIERMRQYS